MTAGGVPPVTSGRELTLCAWPEFELPALDHAVKGVRVVPATQAQFDADYFDTTDLRLLRRGVTVRFRRGEAGGDVWTAELPSEAAALGLPRREISLAGAPGDAMPRLLRDVIRGWTFGASVKRVATIRTTRRTISLCDAADRPLAVIDDDDVSGLRGRRVATRFRELKIELGPDAPGKALRALAKALTAAGAVAGPRVPMLARTLGPAASEPWDLAPPSPGARPNAGELLRGRLVDALTRVVDHHAAAVLDADPAVACELADGVASLRGDLRLFRTLLDAETIDALHAGLDDVALTLAALCDLDASLTSLGIDAANASAGKAAHTVIARLSTDRMRSHERLTALLRSARYGDLLAALRELAMSPPLASAKTKRRATSIVPTITQPVVRGLREDVLRSVGPNGTPPLDELAGQIAELRHVVRVAARFAETSAERAAHDVEHVAQLVEQIRHARVAAAHLRMFVGQSDARTTWSAGVLAGIQIQRAADAADRLSVAVRQLDRKSHWAWLA